jgi:hypothetical protein
MRRGHALSLRITTRSSSTATKPGRCASWRNTSIRARNSNNKVFTTPLFFGSARLQEQGPLGNYYAAAPDPGASVRRKILE